MGKRSRSISFGSQFEPTAGGSVNAPPAADKTPPSPSLTPVSFINLEYASESVDQKLDLYLPATGKKPYRVVVWFHGGGWFLGDKQDDIAQPAEPFLSAGYAVISANYRLSRRAIFPAQIHDAKAVIRWIRANAARYQLDPGKIVAAGGSAGGHLAALLGTSGEIKEMEDLSSGNPEQSSRVNAVVEWYGPIDFLQMDPQHTELGQAAYHSVENSPESNLIGGNITANPDTCYAANPMKYITKNTPPFYIQHGKADVAVPYLQSVKLADALRTAIGTENVTLEILEGGAHLDPVHMSPAYMEKVFSFLDKHLTE